MLHDGELAENLGEIHLDEARVDLVPGLDLFRSKEKSETGKGGNKVEREAGNDGKTDEDALRRCHRASANASAARQS